MSFATVEKYANDWIEAMGGQFTNRRISGRGEISTIPEQMFLLKDWTYRQRQRRGDEYYPSTCGGMCDQEVATFTLREGEGSDPSSPK